VVVPVWKAGGGEGPVDHVHPLPPWRVNLPGLQAPPRKRLGARALRVGTAALFHGWRTGWVAGTRLKRDGRMSAGGQDLRHLRWKLTGKQLSRFERRSDTATDGGSNPSLPTAR
jgi:hypothetical protein